MPSCVVCKSHYFLTIYNNSKQCDDCQEFLEEKEEEKDQVDVNILLNPSGKTKPKFYD